MDSETRAQFATIARELLKQREEIAALKAELLSTQQQLEACANVVKQAIGGRSPMEEGDDE